MRKHHSKLNSSYIYDEMEEDEIEFDITKRTFLVPVDGRIYQLAKKPAEAEHRTVEQIINTLLNRELVKT